MSIGLGLLGGLGKGMVTHADRLQQQDDKAADQAMWEARQQRLASMRMQELESKQGLLEQRDIRTEERKEKSDIRSEERKSQRDKESKKFETDEKLRETKGLLDMGVKPKGTGARTGSNQTAINQSNKLLKDFFTEKNEWGDDIGITDMDGYMTAIELSSGFIDNGMNSSQAAINAYNQVTGDGVRQGAIDTRPSTGMTGNILRIGDIKNGYRYLGGDPKNQASWAKEE